MNDAGDGDLFIEKYCHIVWGKASKLVESDSKDQHKIGIYSIVFANNVKFVSICVG